MSWLEKFISESNRIEGIKRAPFNNEISAHQKILDLTQITVEDLEDFIKTIEPRHRLRDQMCLDVRIGNYIAPRGGPEIRAYLEEILFKVSNGGDPYGYHQEYERLHPFTDGNGRSGRAVSSIVFTGAEDSYIIH